ncbi:MAG: gliding motility protein GldM [Chitinophagales bacterium]|nr:gliding motility protein GldM [Chitinophagales bacterium]
MAIPKENRQQMINMMYLVLTAMLALNVSSEILNAFTVVNKSLKTSNVALDQNNKGRFAAFDQLMKTDPDNILLAGNKKKAEEAMQIADNMSAEIDALLSEIESKAGGIDEETGELKKRDDIEIATRLLVHGDDAKKTNQGKGYALVKTLTDGRKQLLSFFTKEEADALDKELQLKFDPIKPGGDWVVEQFYQMPAVAAKTLLLKLKNDVKSTTGEVIARLQQKRENIVINAPVKLNKFGAKIIGPTYVMQGDPFKAELFLSAASSEAGAVTIVANGSTIPTNEDGVGVINNTASGIGEKTISGSITLKNKQTGKNEVYEFEPFKYTVAAPFGNVSADKMNVFYIGVDNPVTVSAAGVSASKVSASISSGSITGGGGKYNVRVSSPGAANVTITANGKTMGTFPFRVKNIPDPKAKVGNKDGGAMGAGEMKVQLGLAAVLENFDFDAKFSVLSYQFAHFPKREDPVILPNNGALFSGSVKNALSKVKPGDVVYFEEIRVQGPDGTTRKIPSIVFKIV